MVQAASYSADTFLGALNRAMSKPEVATICGSNHPHSLDKQPRVEYIKQYDDTGTTLHPTFGSSLKEFSEQYSVPLETQQKSQKTDFSRRPRAMFAQAHLHRTKVLTAERATWAAVVYEAAFDKKEPANNPFHRKKQRQRKKSQQTPSPAVQQQQSEQTQTSTQPTTQPSDTPTDAPAKT